MGIRQLRSTSSPCKWALPWGSDFQCARAGRWVEAGRKVPRVLCRYTWHKFLWSQCVKKRLRSRKVSGMLSGRPATGFHQLLGECQWRNEGVCRRGFPMGVQAGMQLQARHTCTACSSAKLCPVPWKPNKNLRSELFWSYLLQHECSGIGRSLTDWARSSTSAHNFCSSGGHRFIPATCFCCQLKWKLGKALLVSPSYCGISQERHVCETAIDTSDTAWYVY